MDNLRQAFDDVADWCERHLEDHRGREIGMTFGAMLRAYGRLATLPSRLSGDDRAAKERQLNAKAEELLMELSTRFLVAYGWVEKRSKIVEPMRSPPLPYRDRRKDCGRLLSAFCCTAGRTRVRHRTAFIGIERHSARRLLCFGRFDATP